MPKSTPSASAEPKPTVGRARPARRPPATPAALARRAKDARSVRSKQAVLEAATALYLAEGHGGFTVGAVAQAAGVAKTTIYRHWPTQGHLLTAVIARFAEQHEIPDRGSLREDLIEHFLVQAHAVFSGPKHRTLQTLSGLLQAAEQEPGLINVVNFTVGKLLEALRVMIRRAHARGELRLDHDPELMVKLLFGAMSSRSTLGEVATDAEIVAMIDLAVDGIRRR